MPSSSPRLFFIGLIVCGIASVALWKLVMPDAPLLAATDGAGAGVAASAILWLLCG